MSATTSTTTTTTSSNSGNTGNNKATAVTSGSTSQRQSAVAASRKEVSHYVVTAHPPGVVIHTTKCNFLAPHSLDVLVSKARRLEVRQLRGGGGSSSNNTTEDKTTTDDSQVAATTVADTFPAVLQLDNIHGSIVAMEPLWNDKLNDALSTTAASSTTTTTSSSSSKKDISTTTSLWNTTPIFVLQDRFRYAVLQYNAQAVPYPMVTHASGSLAAGRDEQSAAASAAAAAAATSTTSSTTHLHSTAHLIGRTSETGPIVAVDPECRCIALHLYDGLLTILPIHASTYQPAMANATAMHAKSGSNDNSTSTKRKGRQSTTSSSLLGEPFHCRIEERTVLALHFLEMDTSTSTQQQLLPLLCVLHQDARGTQHVTSHAINLRKKQLHLYHSQSAPLSTPWLKKSAIDGGSAMMISVPPTTTTTTIQPSTTAAAAAAASSSSDTTNTTAPVHAGGIIVVGQRQFTYISPGNTAASKVVPVPQALYLTYDRLPDDPATGTPRFLLGDEFGNLHMLSIVTVPTGTGGSSSMTNRVVALQLETLGSCTVSSSLCYLEHGLCFVGSAMGDSQLLQIHDEPVNNNGTATSATTAAALANDSMNMELMESSDSANINSINKDASGVPEDVVVELMETTYISVVEEYTNLGPILDFDLVPTTPGSASSHNTATSANATGNAEESAAAAAAAATAASSASSGNAMVQSQVVTASGTSKSGSIRVIRNGIGMNEYAAVDMAGIQAMWAIRKSFLDPYDTYLVQSFVGETRVLGVTTNAAAAAKDDDEDEIMEQPDQNDNENSQEEDDDEEEEEAGGTLEEVFLPGLEAAASSLYVGNVQGGDRLLQITESEVLLIAIDGDGSSGTGHGQLLDTWAGDITVAAANEAGQIAVAMAGGRIVYLSVVDGNKIAKIYDKQMDREVSCIDLHPFVASHNISRSGGDMMDLDNADKRSAFRSSMVAVGLWDDFTVRLLSLDQELEELVCIHLSTTDDEDEEMETDAAVSSSNQRRNRNNMMARSLCLITLDFSSSNSSNTAIGGGGAQHSAPNPGVNMLFVGLGDGTLISFAVVESMGVVTVQSKKEVCLGTQCINLIPLNYSFSDQHQHLGGTCVLATGDRPTVIYLAGVGGTSQNNSSHTNPKLCYSNVNVAASDNDEEGDVSRPPSHQAIVVNVAAPFYSPLLFGGTGSGLGTQQYSLCVADDASLRLGVIDDIQKLHVTTCRLGMAPRRIVHCPDGRLFAVGCIESGIKQFGFGGNFGGVDEGNMGNCIRFMDDTTFDDLERVDLEPFEMILSMVYATMKVPSIYGKATDAASAADEDNGKSGGSGQQYKPFLLVGTAYALPDEDEPTRGRILVYSCQGGDEANAGTNTANGRAVRLVTEFSVEGGVYSMTQFYEGMILVAVNSRTHLCQLVQEDMPGGMLKLQYIGNGHFGHILSLSVKSRAKRSLPMIDSSGDASMDLQADQNTRTGINSDKKGSKGEYANTGEEMLAIVGDLMRSISLVQYYPQHQTLEEIARDFNVNWTTAVEMLTDNVYLGAENWNNLFCLRRNTTASSEEVRCRLDTIGEFHFGEMTNKFMSGSLVMPVSSNANSSSTASTRRGRPASPSKKVDAASPAGKSTGGSMTSRIRRPVVVTGSQTLFGTASGTLGVVLGMDARTAAFFSTLERAMANPKVIRPIGDFLHAQYRACHAERRIHPAHGFVDGDLVESFLDLDRVTMEAVIAEMNRDRGWEFDDSIMRGSNTGGQDKDDKDASTTEVEDRPELTVDDVLAMVEEMTMLH